MNKQDEKIFQRLRTIQQQAYCPYSHYPVAAIIIDDRQQQYEGVNVENAAYGLTTCAEQNAIAAGIINGLKAIKQVHILAGNSEIHSAPCGACRQVINEFASGDCMVFVGNIDGNKITHHIRNLLPADFGKNIFNKQSGHK